MRWSLPRLRTAPGRSEDLRIPLSKPELAPGVEAFLDAGLRNISLADTAGHATPEQVESLFGRIFALESDLETGRAELVLRAASL